MFKSVENVGAHMDTIFTKMLVKGLAGIYLPIRCERHPNDVMKPKNPEDFPNLSPDGGCERDCGFSSIAYMYACEHAI